jgi:hypothetical protein
MRFRPANINYLRDYNLQTISESKPFWTFVIDRLCVEERMEGDEEESACTLRSLRCNDDDEFHTLDDYDEDEDEQTTIHIVRYYDCKIPIIP